MKNIKYFVLTLLSVLALSACSKHKIYYETEYIANDVAEFQIFNDLAIRSGEAAANTTMNCVVLGTNDTLAFKAYPLNARNVIPSGGTTRFFVRKPGSYQLRGWKKYEDAVAGLDPDYETTIVLTTGKQMIHIYNWYQDALVMDYDYPFIRADRPQDIGEPVAFGEMTGYCPIVVPNFGIGFTGGVSSLMDYYQVTVYTRILDADTGAEIVGEDYWASIRLGRFLIHTCYAKDIPANEVLCYQFYAL